MNRILGRLKCAMNSHAMPKGPLRDGHTSTCACGRWTFNVVIRSGVFNPAAASARWTGIVRREDYP